MLDFKPKWRPPFKWGNEMIALSIIAAFTIGYVAGDERGYGDGIREERAALMEGTDLYDIHAEEMEN